jgi:hypothetical protein
MQLFHFPEGRANSNLKKEKRDFIMAKRLACQVMEWYYHYFREYGMILENNTFIPLILWVSSVIAGLGGFL